VAQLKTRTPPLAAALHSLPIASANTRTVVLGPWAALLADSLVIP
jgi:hypothetical protein